MQQFFSNVEDADLPGNKIGFFPADQRFVLRVSSVESFTSRPPKLIPFYCLQGEVLWTTASPDLVAVGTHRKWLQKLNNDAAPGAIKAIVMVLNNITEDIAKQIDQETASRKQRDPHAVGLWEELCLRSCWTQKKVDEMKGIASQRYLTAFEQSQFGWPLDPHVGKVINLETRSATGDKEFTYHNWSVNEQSGR